MSPRAGVDAVQGGKARIGRSGLERETGRHSGQRQRHAFRLHLEGEPRAQDLDGDGAGRIARDDVRDGQADRIEGARDRNAEALKPMPSAILQARRGTRFENCEGRFHPHSTGSGFQPAAARWRSAAASTLSTGTKRTRSPGLSSGSSCRAISQSTTGVDPIRCQPPGLSSG